MPANRINQPPSSKHGEYKKPRKRSVSGAILTFAVVVIAIVFLMSVFLRISDISVKGNEHYTDEEIIKAIDIEQGDNLFFFDRFAAISRVFATGRVSGTIRITTSSIGLLSITARTAFRT